MISFSDLKQNPWQSLTVAVLTVVLILTFVWGWRTGQRQAQATVVTHNAQALKQALQFFYSDQNRYPSDLEFADRQAMSNYLTAFPVAQFQNAACNQAYRYHNLSFTSYELDICVPRSTSSFVAGWNKVTN